MARPFRGVINVDVRAWAFNTPFKLWKWYSNFEGGTADPMIVSWPAQIASTGLRRQYVHAIDAVVDVSGQPFVGLAAEARMAFMRD
jgi:hypothetical protein